MEKQNKKNTPKHRIGAKSLKEFYSLSREEKIQYVQELEKINPDFLGDVDIYILNFYSKKEKSNNKFLSIEEDYGL